MSPLPRTHSVEAVAAMLGKKRRWVLDAAAANPRDYPSLKFGKDIRFTDAHVEHILASHTRTSGEPEPVADDAWGRPARSRRAS